MMYRAKCTNWVERLKKIIPGIGIVSDPAGYYYAECGNETIADSIELINKLQEKSNNFPREIEKKTPKIYWVYPVDENGKILSGFCPTVCNDNDAIQIANSLFDDLNKHNIGFDCVVIVDVKFGEK